MPEALHLPYNEKDMRLDYDAQTEGQPRWQGFAPPGTATSASAWTIYAFTYETLGGVRVLNQRRTAFKVVWDDRATVLP